MSARTIRRLGWLLAALVGAAFFISYIVYPRIEPAAFYHDVLGIDVSHHQGDIDWDAAAGDGVGFAYIKASEGETFNDPRFSRNWFAAEQAGIVRGAYHFFTLCSSGKLQAENFMRVVPEDPNALPPAVDAEHMGPCSDRPAVADPAAEIDMFARMLTAHYKKPPIIYTTREFHDAHLAGKFPQTRFWIRSLMVPPRFRQSQWSFWQYHNRGLRAGISGPVALNAFGGTRAELEALASPPDKRR